MRRRYEQTGIKYTLTALFFLFFTSVFRAFFALFHSHFNGQSGKLLESLYE
jgi:hypothetical protein